MMNTGARTDDHPTKPCPGDPVTSCSSQTAFQRPRPRSVRAPCPTELCSIGRGLLKRRPSVESPTAQGDQSCAPPRPQVGSFDGLARITGRRAEGGAEMTTDLWML